ncbi:MAG: flagellin domain-containing [Geobacteraceae bacterium]|nr:MAG: flagellin domain-containing [Geobacteraceae bacterium]
MAISDISLTAGMKNNLLQLQGTKKATDQTQNRLSSGKKVNTPLDNPTNFFAAQNHVNRANDLDVRKDGMSEAVQMLRSADAGIKAITSLINAAKGVADAANATTSVTDRSAYGNTFNTLRTQIDKLASDSSYRGTNLVNGDNKTVEFSAKTGDATLTVTGFTSTSAGLTIAAASVAVAADSSSWASTAASGGANAISFSASQLDSALTVLRSKSADLSANLSVVTTRQDYTDSMINNLTTGADNLTLADMNEEGANMLMLQTRQNLGISSLSMSSQAAQAVLRLF